MGRWCLQRGEAKSGTMEVFGRRMVEVTAHRCDYCVLSATALYT